jgi:hypothetical protein
MNATSAISIMRTAPASTIGDIAGAASDATVAAASASRCGAVRAAALAEEAAVDAAARIMLRVSNSPC